MIDKLNIGQKFIITYRPNTHNGEARPKLKNGKDTRQITRRAQWNEKCRVVKDQEGNIQYLTYYDLDQFFLKKDDLHQYQLVTMCYFWNFSI